MGGGEIAVIYAVLMHVAFFGGIWLYSHYLKRRGGGNPE